MTRSFLSAVLSRPHRKTSAEIAAGVTPTDYSLPPGTVTRYGTNTTPGTTDMTLAIQAAIDVQAAGGTVPFAPAGTYKCTSTIYITGSCNFSEATFDFGTNYTGKAVVISPTKSLTPGDNVTLAHKHIYLPKITQTKSALGWAGVAGSYGLYVVNVRECCIYNVNIGSFETGAYYTGDSTEGTVYNKTYIILLNNNKIQLHLKNHTTCWVNENQFYGGRFTHNSAENTVPGTRTTGTKQIYLEKGSGAFSNGPNTNTFYSPSLEGVVDEYCVHIVNAVYNMFVNARYETGGVAGKTIYLSGAATRINTFFGGYGLYVDPAGDDGILFTEVDGAYGNLRMGPLGTAINNGSIYSAVFAASHHASGGYPAFASYHFDDDVQDRFHYTASMAGDGIHIKNGPDDVNYSDPNNPVIYDRVHITNNGNIRLGGGSATYDVGLARQAANLLQMDAGDSFKVDGTWNGGTIRLGNYYLWVDATGDLRIKSGAPANDTDGTIVGTQS